MNTDFHSNVFTGKKMKSNFQSIESFFQPNDLLSINFKKMKQNNDAFKKPI